MRDFWNWALFGHAEMATKTSACGRKANAPGTRSYLIYPEQKWKGPAEWGGTPTLSGAITRSSQRWDIEHIVNLSVHFNKSGWHRHG